MYDLAIKGGRIYDGSGMLSYNGDVGIANGKIVEIGRLNGGAEWGQGVRSGGSVREWGHRRTPPHALGCGQLSFRRQAGWADD